MNVLAQATTPTPQYGDLALFGQRPFWLTLIMCVAVFLALILLTLFTTWFERKVVARMQQRTGPKQWGPFGLLGPIYDGIKLALKQGITPKNADTFVYLLAPALSAMAAFMVFAVIPVGPVVSIFGVQTPLQLTDFPVAVLYVLAAASIGIYGIVLAGWSSGSTYSLLGGLRSSAQMISYEIAMGLSFVSVFLYASTMSTSGIVAKQSETFSIGPVDINSWYALLLPVPFVIYLIAMVGETNRAPFDLPEAEGELVAGYLTEYSGLRFASFYLAEYINMINVSAVAITLFLGGWQMPAPISTIWPGANEGWWPLLWFVLKLYAFIFVFVWLRGTLPRLRYDQFMRFGWKVLIPVSIVWILAVATIRALNNTSGIELRSLLLVLGVVLAVVAAFAFILDVRRGSRKAEEEPQEYDGFSFGYPVPPLPGQQPDVTRRARATVTTTAVPTPEPDAGTEGEETTRE